MGKNWKEFDSHYEPLDVLDLAGGAAFAWYSADYYDANGSADGGFRLLDRVGAGHVDFNTAPEVGTCAEFNNQPCLTMDGTQAGVSILPASSYNFLHNGSDCAVITVIKGAPNPAAVQRIVTTTNASTQGVQISRFNTDILFWRVADGTTAYGSNFPVDSGVDTQLITTITGGTDTLCRRFFDSAELLTDEITTTTADATYTLSLFGTNVYSQTYTGDWSELVILKKPDDMSSADFNESIARIEYLLAVKYGLRDVLPAPLSSNFPFAKLGAMYVADYGISTETGVSEWKDKSLWANHVSQATTTAQPALTTLDNGAVALQGASGDYLDLSAYNQGATTQPGEMLASGEWNTDATTQRLYDGVAAGRWLLEKGTTNIVRAYAGTFSSDITNAIVDESPFVIRTLYDGADSTASVKESGAENIDGDIGDVGSNTMAGITIMSAVSGANPFLGKISGCVFANDELTQTEADAVMDVLGAYTGVEPYGTETDIESDLLDLSGGSLFGHYRADVYDETGSAAGGLRLYDLSGNVGHMDATATSGLTAGTGINGQPKLIADGTAGIASILSASEYAFLHDGTESAVIVVREAASTASLHFGGTGTTTTALGVQMYGERYAVGDGAANLAQVGSVTGNEDPKLWSIKCGNESLIGDEFTEDSAIHNTDTGWTNPTGDPSFTLTFLKRAAGEDYWIGDLYEIVILKKPDDMSSEDFDRTIATIESKLNVKYGLRNKNNYSQKSLEFGTNQYVSIGTSISELQFEYNKPFSVSFWLNKGSFTGSEEAIIGNALTANPYTGWNVAQWSDGRIRFQIISTYTTNICAVDASAPGIINDGNWHHIAVSYAGDQTASNMKIWLDGEQLSTTTIFDNLSASIVAGGLFVLGSLGGTLNYLNGKMDEAIVMDRALTNDDIGILYNRGYPKDIVASDLNDNIVSYWPLGDADTYPTARDKVSDNDGTMTNMSASNIVDDSPGT